MCHTVIFHISTKYHFYPCKHFIPLFFYLKEGIYHIQIGCNVQEAAARYQNEGFSRIYMACTGSNMQKFIDLLETMFGDLDIDDIDILELETKTTKGLHEEAEMAETASIVAETEAIPKDKITKFYTTSLRLPHEFGIPPDSLPKTENVKERSTRNPAKKVKKFYYACRICSHSSQNKSSMMMHTRRCMNIKLICVICNKAYDSSDDIKKHINEVHDGRCTSEAISMAAE